MRYQQFTNENTDLSYYEEKKEITAGLSGLDLPGVFSDADFKAVYSAIYVYVFSNVSGLKKAMITGAYIPDMLRLYMNTVRQTRKAFEWKDYNEYWLPLFVQKGFDSEVIGYFFKKFEELHQVGAVPRSIWYPNPQSSGTNGGGTGTGTLPGSSKGIPTGVWIGAGVLAVGTIAFFAMK